MLTVLHLIPGQRLQVSYQCHHLTALARRSWRLLRCLLPHCQGPHRHHLQLKSPPASQYFWYVTIARADRAPYASFAELKCYQWHEHADKADIVMRMEGKQTARSSCVCRVSVTHPDNCRCRMGAFCCALCWIIICLACILQHVFQHHVGFTGLAAHSSRCMYAMWIPCQKQATCCYQQRLLSPPWVYPLQHQRCRWP